jgi:hypothetical protein
MILNSTTPVLQTMTVTETRQENRNALKQPVQVWLPTVTHNYGSWSASWDMVSYSQVEADANLAQLLLDHSLPSITLN